MLQHLGLDFEGGHVVAAAAQAVFETVDEVEVAVVESADLVHRRSIRTASWFPPAKHSDAVGALQATDVDRPLPERPAERGQQPGECLTDVPSCPVQMWVQPVMQWILSRVVVRPLDV